MECAWCPDDTPAAYQAIYGAGRVYGACHVHAHQLNKWLRQHWAIEGRKPKKKRRIINPQRLQRL